MSLISQLHNTLSDRFQTGEKNISSTDFLGDSAVAFVRFLGSDVLRFTADGSIGALVNQQFKVSGKLDLWNLGLLDFGMTIEENAGKVEFTLVPEHPIANWHFGKSFPDLQNSYLDYLHVESSYLIATSFDHDWINPSISLKTGLNYYGIAQVSEAIASLKELYPTLNSITIKGTISSVANPCQVNLQAALPDPDANTTDAVLLMDYDSTKSEAENNLGVIKEKFHRGNYTFNQILQVPFDASPLAKVYHILQRKLQDDQLLSFQSTDLGGTLAAKFSTVLGTDSLVFAKAKISQSDHLVEVIGETALFGLPDSTIFHFRIFSNVNSLEMVVYPDVLSPDWKPSKSFPQTQNSFFDDLNIQNPLLIASSYSFTYENPAITLVQGLNLYFQSSNPRSLERLKELTTAYGDSISFQGIVVPSGSKYRIKLQTAPVQDLALQLLGLHPITFQSPVLNLQSEAEEGISNTVFLSGICVTPTLTYAASIQIPMDWSPYFELLPNEKTRGLANIVGVLTLSDSQNLDTLFPSKFAQLNNISLQGPEIYFATLGDQKTLVNSTMTLVDEGGNPRLWQLLDSPNLSVGNLQVGITYGYFGLNADNRDFIFRGSIGGTIVMGTTSAVGINLMVPLSGDWVLSVTGASIPSIADIATFLQKPMTSLTAPLPNNLYNTNQASTISEIQIGFNPFTPSLSFVSFALKQGSNWELLPNFSVENWTVFLHTDATKDYAVTGHLHGFIKIGTVANIEADLPIPPGDQGWTLGLKEGTSIQFPSIGEILKLAGSDPSSLPESFTTFGAFDIVDLAVNFNPSPAEINWFRFAMQGRQEWVLIGPNKLVISDIVANLNIAKKTDGGFESIGEISGTVAIYDSPIWVGVKKEAADQPWKLGVLIEQPIHIPGLKDLASWMMKKDMTSYLPDAFMPFGQGFDLTDFNVIFDLSHNTLQTADFTIINSAKWNAIPGVLGFDKVQIQAKINNFNQSDQALAVHIECVLSLGSADIKFTADRQSAPKRDDPWAFSLSLQQAVTFNSLIEHSNLGTDLSIPNISWLPVLTLNTLEGRMIPDNGIYNVSGSATMNWQIPFINIDLPILDIGGMIDVRQKPGDDANNYKKGVIYGTLNFASLQAGLSLQLGSAGIDTIFTASLTAEQAKNIKLTQLSNQLIASSTDTTTNKLNQTVNWEKLAPSDLDQSKIHFGSAYLYFNQTQKQLFLYGEITNFGSAILLAQQAAEQMPGTTNTEQGYLFAFALADQFTFSKLFSGLAFIDDVLRIRQASLVINSYPVSDAAALKTQLDKITTNPLAPAAIRSPLALSKFPTSSVNKGVHLFADLDLSTPLFSKITALHKDNDAPAVSLYAFFPQGSDSSSTVFSAELANFTLFDTLSFKGASQPVNGIAPKAGPFLQYAPKSGGTDTSSEFTFIGQIGVTAFAKTLAFDGALVVNQEFARLTLQPPARDGQSLLPFPDVLTEVINLQNLGLDFTYTFAKTKPSPVPASVELDLYGSVSILETIDFTGHLHLISASGSAPVPVLVEIALTSDLSISRIVDRLVSKAGSTFTWPTNFFDIAFLKEERNPQTQVVTRKSTLYYYKASNDLSQKFASYNEGYNLESTVALTVLEQTLTLNLAVNIQPGMGIKAQLGLSTPINLYILQLAGPTQASTAVNGVRLYEHGPTLVLDTTKSSPEFGFSTGFNFLQKPFGAATVLFGKDKNNDLKISGTFSPSEEFPPFNLRSTRQQLGFSYSKNEGFKVSNWPDFIAVYQDVLKIMQQLEAITDAVSSSDPCSAIADFAADVAFKTKFGFTNPQFITQDKQLHFVLNGTYTVVLLSEVEVCTVTLPKALNVPIPNDMSLDNLPIKIAEALGAAALNFVKALVDNPDALAKFIGIVAAKNAAKIGARMLCRGLVDATVKAAIDTAAGVVLDAAANAGAGVGTILGGANAINIIGNAIKAIANSNNSHGGQGSSSSTGHSSGGQQDPNPTVPVLKNFTYSNGMLVINWDGVMFASEYRLWISKPNGADLIKENVGYHNSKTVSFNEITPGIYASRLAAVRGNFTSGWSEALTLNKLGIPTGLKLELDSVSGKLKASWTQVSGASSYSIQILKDSSIYQENLNNTTLQYELDPLSLPSGTYHVVVKANGANNTIPSESSTSNSLFKPSAPNSIAVQLDKEHNKISANWANALGNNGYRLHLLDSLGKPINGTTVEIPKDIHSGSIDLSRIPAVAIPPFTLQVQTLAVDKLDSPYASGLPAIEWLEAPQNVTLAVDQSVENITVGWQVIKDAESYRIEVVRADDPTVIVATGTASKNERSKNFPIDSFAGQAGTYRALVKAIGNDSALDSLKTQSLATIDRLVAPLIDPPSIEDRGMRAHIHTSLTIVESFQVQLVVDGIPQKESKLQISPPAGNAHPFFSIADRTLGTEFKVQARSLAPNAIPSQWITGAEGISRLASPEIQSLTFDESSECFTATLAASIPGASRYFAQLLIDQVPTGHLIMPENDIATPQLYFLITLNRQMKGEKFQVQVRALGEGNFASNWSLSKSWFGKLDAPQFKPLVLRQGMLVAQLLREVPHAERYQFRLMADDLYASEAREVPSQTGHPDLLEVTFTLPWESEQHLAKDYQVEVRAFAKGYLPSSHVMSKPIERLQTPNQIVVALDGEAKQIAATWSPVSGNAGYTLRLLDGAKHEIPGSVVSVGKDAIQGNIPTLAIPPGAIGPFTLQVKTLGIDQLDSAYRDGEPSLLTISNEIHITESHVWLPETRQLPLEINLDFTCRRMLDTFAVCFTDHKELSGNVVLGKNLTWFVSPKRPVITFLTRELADSAKIQEPNPWAKLEVGRQYHMRCVIRATKSTYYIDGIEYAIAEYPAEVLPTEGYIGFVIYYKSDILVKNFQIVEGEGISD